MPARSMTHRQTNEARSSPSNPPRRWWKLHASTYLVAVGVLALLVLANVPGQVVVAPDPFALGRFPILSSSRSCEHGWPVTYLWREEVLVGNKTRLSPWSLSEGVLRASYFGLGLDLLAGAAALVLGVALYEAWRRRRSKVYQLHVRDLLVLMTVVSVAFGWLGWQAKQHRDEQEVLRQLGVTTTHCQWQPGGPSWMREWIGADRFRILDRVVSVELGHKQQFARWMHTAQSNGVLSGSDSPNDLGLPLIEGTDFVMPGLGGAFPTDNLPRYRAPAKPEASQSQAAAVLDADLAALGRLPNLQELILNQTGISNEQMTRVASLTGLRSLELSECRIGDEGLAFLSELTNLEGLFVSGVEVTDDGLEHLKKLNRLKNLRLETPWITDAGLAHIQHLTNLESLQIDSEIASGAALQHIGALTKLKYLFFHEADVADAHLAHIAHLTELEWLSLKFSGVTDAGLLHLSGMINLRNLDLGRAHITDAGLSHLKGLANLESLRLNHTEVTDTGLIYLETLTKLDELNLVRTQVTDAGLVHLQLLPNLRIVDLRNSRVTKQGVGKLRKALRKQSIVLGP